MSARATGVSDRDQAERLLRVSRETWEALAHFVSQLNRWQKAQNLVSAKTLDAVWVRHVVDCAQLYQRAGSAGGWLDIGSGAGLPGLIGAILAKYDRADTETNFVLVESNQRKCAFLRTVSRELDLMTTIVSDRIERLAPDQLPPVRHISARAVAPLPQLLRWGTPWWRLGADGHFQKGRDYSEEVEKAAHGFSFDLLCYPSLVDADSVILHLTNIAARTGNDTVE